jgi:hypothetical protein
MGRVGISSAIPQLLGLTYRRRFFLTLLTVAGIIHTHKLFLGYEREAFREQIELGFYIIMAVLLAAAAIFVIARGGPFISNDWTD